MTDRVLKKKKTLRLKRKLRVRDRCFGREDRPRVTVFRSNRYFYAQAINDETGHTLASIDSKTRGLGNTKADTSKLGEEFASLLLSKGISGVVFDRNGYLYHGVVASFAGGMRSSGVVL